jgi:phage FluMu protein Com
LVAWDNKTIKCVRCGRFIGNGSVYRIGKCQQCEDINELG